MQTRCIVVASCAGEVDYVCPKSSEPGPGAPDIVRG